MTINLIYNDDNTLRRIEIENFADNESSAVLTKLKELYPEAFETEYTEDDDYV